MTFYLSAFFIGLAGSVHCLGMCGPLSLALPFSGTNKGFGFVFKALAYHISRITGYGILGLGVGILSHGMQLTGLQPVFSILAGIILLFLGFFGIIPEVNSLSKIPLIRKIHQKVNRKISHILSNPHWSAPCILGLLNALLPCGMIYIALGTGLSSGNMTEAALYLMFFGIGTLPLLLLSGIFGQYISLNMRRKWQKAIPIMFLFTGILLINKGVNMELPQNFNFWDWGLEHNSCDN
jgi:sulfite exporter TauE/SafE